MAIHFSDAVRNAQLDSIETTIGTSAILEIISGSVPASTAASDSGTVLATLNLPSNWMADAASGVKSKSGTWEDVSADASGTATHYRIWDSTHTTCHVQGSVTITGGGGNMELDNKN